LSRTVLFAWVAKSARVTRPVAVKPVVTVREGAVSPLGSVVEIDGTPPLEVTRTPLLPVVRAETVVPFAP
jgi:hypothetical protein